MTQRKSRERERERREKETHDFISITQASLTLSERMCTSKTCVMVSTLWDGARGIKRLRGWSTTNEGGFTKSPSYLNAGEDEAKKGPERER